MSIKTTLKVETFRQPESLGAHVLSQVRELILSGEVSPGDSLPETELASLFEVSRGPIREALAALEREGLVVNEPRRRARVAVLDAEAAEEIYSLRRSLEILAAERAVKSATEADFAKMREILTLMETELVEGDPIRLSHLDAEFHDSMYRASGHKRLQQAWNEIRSQVTFFLITRNKAAIIPKNLAVEDHYALLEALMARDKERLVQLTEEHLLGAYQRLTEAIRSSPDA